MHEFVLDCLHNTEAEYAVELTEVEPVSRVITQPPHDRLVELLAAPRQLRLSEVWKRPNGYEDPVKLVHEYANRFHVKVVVAAEVDKLEDLLRAVAGQ